MRRVLCGRFLAGILVLVVLAPAATLAQTVVVQPPPEFTDALDQWVTPDELQESPFSSQRFVDVHAADIQAGRVHAVASNMVDEFAALDWGDNDQAKRKILRQLFEFLHQFRLALIAEGIDGPLDTPEEQSVFLLALNSAGGSPENLRSDFQLDALGNDVPAYFVETDDEILLYTTMEDEKFELRLTKEQVRQWRLLENALNALIYDQIKLIQGVNVEVLRNAVVSWENYLERGFSQMPWESFINGRVLAIPELGPPSRQWIVVHPGLGVEMSVYSIDEARVKPTLMLDLLGHIWYTGDLRDNFWGVSAGISLREDIDPGIAATLHIRRNWSLGVSWRDVDQDPFVFLSFDLFQFAREEGAKFEEAYQGVREQLGMD